MADSRMANSQPDAAVCHGFSIDVEDYRQILSSRFRGRPGHVTPQLERGMDVALGLLADAKTAATLFVTGTIAEQRPDLVRRWAALGHEIASHGYDHTPIWAMTADRFREELVRAKKAIEDAAGAAVTGYRAPIFSVRWDTLWALDVIREAGFMYDSSVVPVRMRRYGVTGFAARPRLYALPSGRDLVEIPMSTARVAGMRVPVAGGGYFRLFGFRRIRRAVEEAQRRGDPFILYAHPDEFSGERFHAADLAASWKDRLAAHIIAAKTNLGRGRVKEIAVRLVAEFRFGALGRLADRVRAAGPAQPLDAACRNKACGGDRRS
jgi:polysaccharide deacetylase family protein (PEP-CTERM system associated)